MHFVNGSVWCVLMIFYFIAAVHQKEIGGSRFYLSENKFNEKLGVYARDHVLPSMKPSYCFKTWYRFNICSENCIYFLMSVGYIGQNYHAKVSCDSECKVCPDEREFAWKSFVGAYEKMYATKDEYDKRKQIFLENLDWIKQENDKTGQKYGVYYYFLNKDTDMTNDELAGKGWMQKIFGK